jgi:hypothetical protein
MKMRYADIEKVKGEIKRVSVAIKALEDQQSKENAVKFGYRCSRETGAVKRASMDLTRALADMRHPCRERK